MNFDEEIKRVEDKIAKIKNLAEEYASMALEEAIAMEMALDNPEDSIFADAFSYEAFSNWFLQAFSTQDTISFGVKFKIEGQDIVSRSLKMDEVLGRYANAFYAEVERILNVH